MLRLHLTHALETSGDLLETFFSCRLGESRIHDRALVFLLSDDGLQVRPRILNAAEEFKLRPRMFPFILGDLQEEIGNMILAFFPRGVGIVPVRILSPGLIRKSVLQIFLCSAPFQAHVSLPPKNSSSKK